MVLTLVPCGGGGGGVETACLCLMRRGLVSTLLLLEAAALRHLQQDGLDHLLCVVGITILCCANGEFLPLTISQDPPPPKKKHNTKTSTTTQHFMQNYDFKQKMTSLVVPPA